MKKSTNYYNKKCLGCGEYFSNDKNKSSYVSNINENTKYCLRCFKLINYNQLDNSKVDNNKIIDNLKEIDYKNNLIILVLDLFDIYNGLIEELKTHENTLVVVNKLGFLPKSFNSYITLTKIKNILDESKQNYIDIILYDSIKTTNIRKINDFLYKSFLNKKKIYIVGKTNAGKSSLINALLKFNKVNNVVSSSPFPNTTINLLKVEINKYFVIDTPGYINDNAIVNYISQDVVKSICDFKNPNSIHFAIKDNKQCFFVEKLFYFQIKEQTNGSISFYCSKNLKIHRTKQEKINDILNSKQLSLIEYIDVIWTNKEYSLDSNKKYNIFVNGVCLISLKNISKIILGVNNKTNIFITEHALI